MKYEFGVKIRAIRERKKMTMKDVAEKAGLSESLISQIERNKVSPAIDTLLSIVAILDIDLEYIFSDFRKNKSVSIVRKSERSKYFVQNVSYEQVSTAVGSDKEHGIEAYFIEIQPGSEKGSPEYGHIGKEMGIVLEGKGDFIFGTESYALEEGDSISFAADVPHILKNSGDKPLKAFWVITPPKLFIKEG